ncbi:hypothetical protein EWH12_19585 [Sphingobium cupriresistens]|uniref:Uncharacterized protein n=1 Tax=Sphingobium cupriresistens TaxID=1132417 RepID=A0A8G1ZEF9_9SPHN|nr:hypothetical protein EWH12_19585 [Sphingobium cupriresistens]
MVSNGPGRINQAFSVRSSTWPKSQLRADWAYVVGGLLGVGAGIIGWRIFNGRWVLAHPIRRGGV